MRNERRDYGRRAACQCRTMKRLLAVNGGGLSAADLVDEHLSLQGAQRILHRFALKFFVRRDGNRWAGTPLLGGCPIVLTYESL